MFGSGRERKEVWIGSEVSRRSSAGFSSGDFLKCEAVQKSSLVWWEIVNKPSGAAPLVKKNKRSKLFAGGKIRTLNEEE